MNFDLLSAVGGDEEMSVIFAEDRTIRSWLDVEAALALGLASAGVMDDAVAARIASACRLDIVDRCLLWSETALVGYPILPLVRIICAQLGSEDARFVHYGATTQDIMDSALALQLRDAAGRLLELVREMGDGLVVLVESHAGTIMAGRTHAQQAVPTTFGAKCAVFLDELTRHRHRLARARDEVSVVSMFGAGGTSAALGASSEMVRAHVALELGLANTAVPWHVARDRLGELAQVAALVSATAVRFAREIIDLSRTEVGEVAEPEGLFRGASSTMPQKANPIWSEMIVGFGVMAQANATAMLRAMEAGSERAAGEWQIEWQALPGALRAAGGALAKGAALAGGLRVFPERMSENLGADGGRIMAEAYMMALASELGRERAHDLVYRAVRESRTSDRPLLDTMRSAVSPESWAVIEASLPTPPEYLGSTAAVCARAIDAWRAGQ